MGMKFSCGTCKYRGKPIMVEDEDTDEIYAEKDSGYFICDRIKHDERWKYLSGSGALVVDGSGYHAALCVESDFGCAKWEEAE